MTERTEIEGGGEVSAQEDEGDGEYVEKECT